MLKNLHMDEFVRVLALMKKRKWTYIAATLASSCVFPGVRIIFGFINKELVNAVTAGSMQLLLNVFILAFIAGLSACIIDPLITYMNGCTIKKTMLDIRIEAFRHIERLPMEYFDSNHTGDLISRVTNDLNAIEGIYNGQIYRVMVAILYGFGAGFTMFVLDWRLSILAVVLGVLSTVINMTFVKSLRTISDSIQSLMGTATQSFLDIIAGNRVIKMFNIENIIVRKYINDNSNLARQSLEVFKKNSQVDSVNFLLTALNFLGILCSGAFMASSGLMDFGTVMAIIMLQGGVTYMFLQLGSFFTQLQGSLAGAKRVFQLLEQPREPERYEVSGEACDGKEMVKLENVFFNYTGDKNILNGLSIEAKQGQIIALAGRSGGGKSSILKLIMGMYAPQSGNITIDGKPLGSYTLQEIRSKIAYVSQDAYMFDDTIRENIRYGKLIATEEEIIAAAKAANAHDFIMNMTENYEAKVGERGTRLSGGQRQRISIARALLKDAPIILLDEPTAALDMGNEQLVQQALNVLMEGRTVIVVAHRLSTVQMAERIYVIEKGKVAEQGRHNDLLDIKGIYYSLHRLQSGQEKLVV